MGLTKRVQASGAGAGVWTWPPADVFLKDHTELAAFLADTSFDGGDSRTTGTLLLFCDDGVPKACLSDRDGGLVCFVAGSSMKELLRRANTAVTAPDADWRAKKDSGSTRKR